MLFLILRWLFRYAVKAYFRSLEIKGKDKIPANGPVIFVSNHTSAFMDPILLATEIRQKLYFLARGEAFKTKLISGIFNILHMIPVYRPEVQPEKVHENKMIFKKCHDHLAAGRSMLIFPEGFSKTERRLRHFKTGTARIALGAESENGFNLGVKIVPIGINYSNPHHFRSDVFVNFADPIDVKDYKDAYEEDPRACVTKLTDEIKKRISEKIVIIEDNKLEKLIRQIEQLCRRTLRDLSVKRTKAEQDLYFSKHIVQAVLLYRSNHPAKMKDFERKLDYYLNKLKQLQISDTQIRNHHVPLKTLEKLVFFTLGFPLFLFGFLANVIPFKTAEFLARKIRVRKDFVGSIKLAFGMFVFLIFYIMQFFVIGSIFSYYIAMVVLLLAYPAGIFTIQYINKCYQFRGNLRYIHMGVNGPELIAGLTALRKELVDQLEKGKIEYLESLAQKKIRKTVQTRLEKSMAY